MGRLFTYAGLGIGNLEPVLWNPFIPLRLGGLLKIRIVGDLRIVGSLMFNGQIT